MFSTAEKAHRPANAVQQKAKDSAFFRKAGTDSFFGQSEKPAFFPSFVQAQLEVSHPDDPQEKEADNVASQVARMAEPAPAAPPAEDEKKKEEVHRAIEEKDKEKEKVHGKLFGVISRAGNSGGFASHASADDEGGIQTQVQAKPISNQQSPYFMRSSRGPPADGGSPTPPFEQSLSSSKGGGSALPDDTRQSMEGRFGADFSGVRVHTGTHAETLSRSINAQAFTYGNDIYFNAGKFSPNTAGGTVLLAHELTHTIQQGASQPKTAASVAARSIQRKNINRSLQRLEAGSQRNAAVELAKAEQGKVSANKNGPDGYRMGWQRLTEYFKTTFGPDRILPEGAAAQPGTVNESQIKTKSTFKGDVVQEDGRTVGHNQPRDAMPSWCGIFAFWALNKGGMPLKKWTLGASMIPPDAAYPGAYQPQAGDLAYRREFSHYALVASADGSNVTSINGNTAGGDNLGGEIQVQTHPKEHWAAFFDPVKLMQGTLRDPGSPEVPGAAPAKSLKELRKELFNVQTKSDGDSARSTSSIAPGPASAGVNVASASAPAVKVSASPQDLTPERKKEGEQEESVSVSRQYDIQRSMDGGRYHEAQRAVSDPDEDPSPELAPNAHSVNEVSLKLVPGVAQRQPVSAPERGPPPRAPPVVQPVLLRKLIQRSWYGDAWDAVSGAVSDAAAWVEKGLDAAKQWLLGKVRDFVGKIPGYRMLCLILGSDPITGAPAPMTGANLLEAGLDLLPLGFMFRALMNRLGIFNDVALWLQGRINELRSFAAGVGDRFDKFWDGLSLSSIKDPEAVINSVAGLLKYAVEGIVNFVTNSASEFLSMVKRVMIREIAAFVRGRIPHLFPLLTVALGFNPETMEKVERNGTNILNAFLEVSEAGREQRTQMQETGTFQKIAAWIDRGIAVFSRAYTLLKAAISGIWDYVTVENLFAPVQTLMRIWDQFSEPVRIVGQFLLDAAIEILKVIKDVLLQRLSAYARQTKGYGLVCVLIGRDPFTGQAVPRTMENIVKGFMSLMDGGEEQYEQLKQSGAIDRIVNKVEAAVAKLNMTPQAIIQLFVDLWHSFSIHDLVHPIDCFMRIVAKFGEPIMRLIRFVIEIIMIVVEAILILMNFPFDLIANIIEKAKLAYELIKKDPVGFFKNLLAAIKQGFSQFFDNILTHLWNGLKAWFLGEVQDAGIPIPTDFSVLGIIKWLLAVLDITMEKIWKKLEERIGKEKVDKIKKIVSMAEKVVGAATEAVKFIEDVRERGFITVVGEKLMEQLSNAWDLVLDALKSWVMDQIIKKVTAKLLSMLDPTGIMAVVNSAIALYKAIQSFIKYLRRMLEIVNSFVEGLVEIAQGAIGKAANFLEGSLAKGIPVAIGFLANQVGLNLSERLKEALEFAREKVDAGLTWVIDKLATLVEKLVSLGKSAVAAVKRWLGLEKKFEATDGTSHRLYMTGSEDNPTLMVATNPIAYASFIATVKVNDTDTKKTEAKAQAVVIAGQIDQRKSQNIPGESKEDKIAAVQTLLDQLAIHTKELFGDPSEAGEPDVQFPAQEGTYGKTMTAVRLNKKQKLKGTSPTSAANASFAILNQRRDPGNPEASYYVKGHLLNENLGGIGNWNNLTPLSRDGNSDHESKVESLVKAAVNSGAVVQYNVTAEYGRAVDPNIIDPADPQAGVKKTIIAEEKNVPLRLKCEADTMEKSGDQFIKKDSIVTTDVVNPVDQNPKSYAVGGTAAIKSYADLETEAKAMFAKPPVDTWAQFQNKDQVHKTSIAALAEKKADLEKLFIAYFRSADKAAELSKITGLSTSDDIQTWTAFKGSRTFYDISDAATKEVKDAFDAKQASLRNQAFASAQMAAATPPPGMLWRDFKIVNHINFDITKEEQPRLNAVQTAFNAATTKKTI